MTDPFWITLTVLAVAAFAGVGAFAFWRHMNDWAAIVAVVDATGAPYRAAIGWPILDEGNLRHVPFGRGASTESRKRLFRVVWHGLPPLLPDPEVVAEMALGRMRVRLILMVFGATVLGWIFLQWAALAMPVGVLVVHMVMASRWPAEGEVRQALTGAGDGDGAP